MFWQIAAAILAAVFVVLYVLTWLTVPSNKE